MKVKVQINFKAPDGKGYRRVINYANPDASNSALKNFVNALNNLTTNDLKSVMKIVNTYLDDEIASDEIKMSEINAILNDSFVSVTDEDGITQIDINAILDGSFEAIEDDDGITQAEIDAILQR